MGTRSTTRFIGKYENTYTEYANIYQQYDGYIEGVGHEIANWLKDMIIVNGYSLNGEDGKHANGIGCLAAQFVAKFKKGIGNLYITTIDDYEEYNYKIIIDEEKTGKADDIITIEVTNYDDEIIFKGTPSELLKE